ncbi:hypothetical protein RB195_023870 [Necator americanus]|uniref:Uncharacterized protein n=1 Tax=Necator americanus TaxID=51031 RepID=A0ABR1EL09_NECAM
MSCGESSGYAAEQHDEVRVEFCPQHSEHEREHSLLIMDATSEVYIVSLLKKAIETEHLTRMMEKVLEEAELCGALCLAGRKMKEFPSVLSTKYDLSDLVSLAFQTSCLFLLSEGIESFDGAMARYLQKFPDNSSRLDCVSCKDLRIVMMVSY